MDEDENDPEIQTTVTQSRHGHSQILHVRQDSANELNQLFDVALNPNSKSKSLPMKLRKLPKSFFQQPDRPRVSPMHAHSRSMGGLITHSTSISHSRSSSTDSSASHHSGLNLSSSNLHQQSSIHANSGLGQRTGNFTPGPGHHPFNNSPGHMGGLQVPQISHSRSKSSPASLNERSLSLMKPQPSNTIEIPPDMPLPQGWEVTKTPDGQPYFMNHSNRTTTWIDPRITQIKEQQERANSMQAANHPQSPMHINSIPNEQSVTQQLPPLPRGWEQATTPQGEIYFINHETRSTSWLDPRLSQSAHPNQSQLNAQMQHQLRKLEINPQQFTQQRSLSNSQMMIKQLTKEKEAMAMKMRQQEILKQSGIDPFLGTGSPSTGSFNHPRSDEYLGGVEEMETDVGNHNQQVMNQQQQQNLHASVQHQQREQQVQHVQRSGNQQQHFPDFLDSLPASSVDFGSEGGSQPSNTLDGEELVPSISDGLSADFINDVESMLNPVVKSENMENMTWL